MSLSIHPATHDWLVPCLVFELAENILVQVGHQVGDLGVGIGEKF